jgi:deoxyadenosine/deoxycytidine kinase
MDNPLKIWFYSTGKIVNDTSLATHYSMEGFKLNLSEDYNTFQELYAKNIKFLSLQHGQPQICLIYLIN